MISILQIQNFKPYQNTTFELSNLTILTGINGMGKSSLIQSLLLLRQSYQKGALSKGLLLNGDLVSLGTSNEVFNKFNSHTSNNLLVFSIVENERQITWKFQRSDGDFLIALEQEKSEDLGASSIFNSHFQYRSAHPISPQENHQGSSLAVEISRQISEESGRGEYTVHFLSYYGRKHKVLSQMRHPKARTEFLIDQVDAWISEISPGVKTFIQSNLTNNEYKLRFQYETDYGYTDPLKPENVGFGLSYTLPLLVATLAAEPNSLLLFENPESHLHPQGQSKLAELFVKAAQSGIQLIIETHSDHIINGTLVTLLKNKFSSDSVKIHHFERSLSPYSANVIPVVIRSDGRIKNPPADFFSQISKDLKELMGF